MSKYSFVREGKTKVWGTCIRDNEAEESVRIYLDDIKKYEKMREYTIERECDVGV